jgi:RNA polymerase sigma-70 factor (ECF subfamily)
LSPPTSEESASDAELVRRVACGDRQAFATLFDRRGAILFGIVLRILHDREEAEDVLQETFLQVWQRAATFDEARGRAVAWLMLIARSRALDRVRGRDVRRRAATELAAESETEAAPASSAANVDGPIVRRALEQISEAERSALLLAYFEGLTQTEIAERQQKPLGTVKTHMRLGLRRLRELLGEGIGR